MKRLGNWFLGLMVAVMIAGAVVPAEAQVDIRVGPRHRRYQHRRHYRHHPYRHHRR